MYQSSSFFLNKNTLKSRLKLKITLKNNVGSIRPKVDMYILWNYENLFLIFYSVASVLQPLLYKYFYVASRCIFHF